jgi:D-serine deaminase-like pyridoxal phosphate-dependent protein
MPNPVSRRTFLGAAAGSATVVAAPGNVSAENKHAPVVLDKPLPLSALSTPALLIDLAAFESNLAKMAESLKARGVGLRPHAKTHKCPVIARKQIDLGAIGICCAKVGEAEVMADASIEDILITSPVVTKEKIDRVIAVAKRIDHLQMVIDNEKTARNFNDAAVEAGVTLSVIIDLDTGTRRTGIAHGEPALALGQVIRKLPALKFEGLQAYAGHIMHVKGYEKRKTRSIETFAKAVETKTLFEKNGFDVAVLSGGGTGTFDVDSNIEGVTDIQAGSYPFMDIQYRAIGDSDSEVFDYFEPSLFVLSTAISKPVEQLITFDAGYKAFSTDAMSPEFRNLTGVVYHWGGDEHGMVQLKEPSEPVELGSKFQLMVPHCDPTVNLYDFYYPYRDGMVQELWPIAARGRSQ